MNNSFHKNTVNSAHRKIPSDTRRKTALPKLGSLDFKVLLQRQKSPSSQGKLNKTKFQTFFEKEKPELKEHLELFKEKASEKDVKNLETAVKKKRLKNKSMVNQIQDIEQMLKTIEIKQKKIKKKKKNDQLGQMMNQIHSLFDKTGGVRGLVKNIKKKANLEHDKMRDNQKKEELRKKQHKAIETLIAEDMEFKTLERRLQEAFLKFESKLQEVEDAPLNLEDELMKLIELKQMLGDKMAKRQEASKPKFEFLKKGSRNKIKKEKGQELLTPMTRTESRKNNSTSVKLKKLLNENGKDSSVPKRKSKTPKIAKRSPSRKGKSKKEAKKEKMKYKSERIQNKEKSKQQANLFSIDEHNDSSIFRQKIRNELKDIKSGKVNFKNFGRSVDPEETGQQKSPKGKSDSSRKGNKKQGLSGTMDIKKNKSKTPKKDKSVKKRKPADKKAKVVDLKNYFYLVFVFLIIQTSKIEYLFLN